MSNKTERDTIDDTAWGGIEKTKERINNQEKTEICPHCGRCPHCDRPRPPELFPSMPYYPWEWRPDWTYRRPTVAF